MTLPKKTAAGWAAAVLACGVAITLAWVASARHTAAPEQVAAGRYVIGPARVLRTGEARKIMQRDVGVPGLVAAAAEEALLGAGALWAAGRRIR